MAHAALMLKQYPAKITLDPEQLGKCIEICEDCALTCTSCADACVGDEAVAELRRCIRTCLDCSDVCEVTARMLSRQTAWDSAVIRGMLAACIQSCTSCADECDRHSEMHGHCRVCGELCRMCAGVCGEALASM
jgi:hypothetical protein